MSTEICIVKRRFSSRLLPPLMVFAVAVGGWYLLAYSLDNNFASADGSPLIIPPPHMLFDGVNATTAGQIAEATLISAGTAFVGLIFAGVVGVLLGVAMSSSKSVESAIWPWLVAVQVTPIIVLTPIIVRVVGPSFEARVLVTVLIAFFPVASNALYGLRAVPQAFHDLCSLAGFSKWRRLLQVQLPSATPAVFAGIRVAAGLSVIGAIVGDFFFTRGTPGLGRLVTMYFQDTRSGPMFVTALVASIVGLAFFMVVGLLRRLLVSPWDHN